VLPDSISAIQAAALPLAGLTALRLLRVAGNITRQSILLTGASGGVGHYVTELAAGAGAAVTAVTASAERGQRLTELGAAEIIHDLADAHAPYYLVPESTGGKNLAWPRSGSRTWGH
jgi:NADPH2:quinone reductase